MLLSKTEHIPTSSGVSDDVLKNKSGNCLGLPLLIGSILGEKGFEHSISHVSSPTAWLVDLSM